MSEDITAMLDEWPYDADENIRIVECADGRKVLQVRQPLGIEQYELDGRPDGARPFDSESVLDQVDLRLARYREEQQDDAGFELSHEECVLMQNEGVLYYYRYLLLFQLNDFDRVVSDTAHNLRICELLENYCRDEEDRNAVLQFKPYIIRMNAMGRAMRCVRGDDPDAARAIIDLAISEIQGLDAIESPAFQFERVRSVNYLRSAREQASEQPRNPRKKLEQELQRAVEAEDFERAARLRDRIRDLSH